MKKLFLILVIIMSSVALIAQPSPPITNEVLPGIPTSLISSLVTALVLALIRWIEIKTRFKGKE